jgi:hypothetical protein
LQTLPSLQYLSVKASVGQHVGKVAEGHQMCAVIILHHANPSVFAKDLKFVHKNVFVQTS